MKKNQNLSDFLSSNEVLVVMNELKKDMKQYSPEYVEKTINENLSFGEDINAFEGDYRDTVYQDRYQDTAYDDHYSDTVTYRDGTKN